MPAKPVTGRHKPPKNDRLGMSQSEGFNRAMKDALEQAAKLWDKPQSVRVKVELEAQVDVWNPGGIGVYSVTLSPLD